MEDDSPVIYGLEFNARALCPQHAEADVIRFLVGSQSLKFENQLHLIDFDDESNIINKNVFLHSIGEIWPCIHSVAFCGRWWDIPVTPGCYAPQKICQRNIAWAAYGAWRDSSPVVDVGKVLEGFGSINSSPVDKNILSTCYNKVSDNKAEIKAAIWRIPPVDETEPPPPDSPGLSHSSGGGYTRPLQLVCQLDNQNENMKSVLWNPSGNGSQIISVSEQHLTLWDMNTSTAVLESVDCANLIGKGQPKFTSGRWNPHHGGSQLATANDTTIRGWDSRTLRQVYTIENAHGQLVRDIDFNPNKQYYMVSCGDDCKITFWDTRKIDEPLMVVCEHSHWVWSIRYNHFHDQLLLSSSSDSRVILHNINSLSSEPFGHLDDEEDEEDKLEKASRDPAIDGVIATFDEHEDSVYASEWSTADPWVFASLSYDGRLVINRVPRAEKYKILL